MANRPLAIASGLTLVGIGAGVAYHLYRSQLLPQQVPESDDNDDSLFDSSWRYIPAKPEQTGNNWGVTPDELKDYFAALERISGIPGSGRIFSLIAYGESSYVVDAHNDDASEISRGSRPAYERAKDNYPRLKYAEEAANFGSGGLFATLGPIHLWSGARHGFAPLVNMRPESMFDIRYAGFSAIVFLYNLHRSRDVRDLVDIKVGWGRPERLSKSGRETRGYTTAREKFQTQAVEAKINLADRNTLPPKLDVSGFRGVRTVYKELMTL